MSLSAVVLTKNEEMQIKTCLKSLQFCNEIIVLDDKSTDDTIKIAKDCNAKVFSYDGPDDFANRRNRAMSHATNDWVLFVDADEVVSEVLQKEIVHAISSDNEYNGFYLVRSDILWKKNLRFGEAGSYPVLRLGKKSEGTWIGRVHEVWKINGKAGYLTQALLHYPHQSVGEYLAELNHYSDLRAAELRAGGVRTSALQIVLYTKGKFFQNYIFKLGVLDGIPGLISALMMSFYSFLTRSKLWQLQQGVTKR